MGAEIAVCSVADIGGGVGRGCVRVEGTGGGASVQLEEIGVVILVDTVHVHLQEIALGQIGAVRAQVILNIPAVGEAVVEDKEVLCKEGAIDMLLEAIVIR